MRNHVQGQVSAERLPTVRDAAKVAAASLVIAVR